MTQPLEITILGLSITSSWGNGHATTYRSLVTALAARGHSVRFLERNVPWYADNCDLPALEHCETHLYDSREELMNVHAAAVRHSDLVIVGSYVPSGVEIGQWVCETTRGVAAFYDIDTPITLQKLRQNECDYLTPELVSRYDCYLSFAGGRALVELEQTFHSPMARPLYCSVDPVRYAPQDVPATYDLGYLGTYSEDRQPALERLLLDPARQWPSGKFVVAGPQYPGELVWPQNVERIEHLPPCDHRAFYNSQRFTMNLTRAEMVRLGHSPSVRLFEAAACGTAIISDWWPGLDEFFVPNQEILISGSAEETLRFLKSISARQRRELGERARTRILDEHTADRRAAQLEGYFAEAARRRQTRLSVAAQGS